MKIIAVLETLVTTGGGFNQSLNAILQMKRICDGCFQFEVFTTKSENVGYLQKLGISAVVSPFSIVDRLLVAFWRIKKHRNKVIGSFERRLMKYNCDLVYFVAPSGWTAVLQQLNYISTVWDLCHRDTPEFPEVRAFGDFHMREYFYQNYLTSAIMVLADSIQLADAISWRYGVDRQRVLPMPFTQSPFLGSEIAAPKEYVLNKYSLTDGYFFYPAQFWAHKNHVRVVEALLILKKSGIKAKVVFSGSDYGNRAHIERVVSQNNLIDDVSFLGFVAAEDMRGLYEGCMAVVMPTYFGPTNLPPLEAWFVGKPLIYPAQFNEQVGDAAILVDPDDANDIASAMNSCMDEQLCEHLKIKGYAQLQKIDKLRTIAEIDLKNRLLKFEKKLSCWR